MDQPWGEFLAGGQRAVTKVRQTPVPRGDLPGLPAAIQPRLKVLEVIYGGMMGDWSGENLDRLLLFLKASLADGLWHAGLGW